MELYTYSLLLDLSRLCRDWSGQSYEVGDYWKIENDTGCSSCVCTASGEINCRSGFCGEKTLPNQSTGRYDFEKSKF